MSKENKSSMNWKELNSTLFYNHSSMDFIKELSEKLEESTKFDEEGNLTKASKFHRDLIKKRLEREVKYYQKLKEKILSIKSDYEGVLEIKKRYKEFDKSLEEILDKASQEFDVSPTPKLKSFVPNNIEEAQEEITRLENDLKYFDEDIKDFGKLEKDYKKKYNWGNARKAEGKQRELIDARREHRLRIGKLKGFVKERTDKQQNHTAKKNKSKSSSEKDNIDFLVDAINGEDFSEIGRIIEWMREENHIQLTQAYKLISEAYDIPLTSDGQNLDYEYRIEKPYVTSTGRSGVRGVNGSIDGYIRHKIRNGLIPNKVNREGKIQGDEDIPENLLENYNGEVLDAFKKAVDKNDLSNAKSYFRTLAFDTGEDSLGLEYFAKAYDISIPEGFDDFNKLEMMDTFKEFFEIAKNKKEEGFVPKTKSTISQSKPKKKRFEREDKNKSLKEKINSLDDKIKEKRAEKKSLKNEKDKLNKFSKSTYNIKEYNRLTSEIKGISTELSDLLEQKKDLENELSEALAPPSISLGISLEDIKEKNIGGMTDYKEYNSRLGGSNKDSTPEIQFNLLKGHVKRYNNNNKKIGELGVKLNRAKHGGDKYNNVEHFEAQIKVLETENKQIKKEIERKIKLLTGVKKTQGLIEESKKVDEKLERASEILGNSVYFDDNKNPIDLEPQYEADIDGGKGYVKKEKIYGEPDHETHKVNGEFFNSKGEQIRSPPPQEIDNSEVKLTKEREKLFSSLLGIMDMEGEYNNVNSPLVSSMDAFTASRVMSEYNGLMDEITEEIGKAYTELSEAVDEETKELIWNKIDGLGELKDELGVLINREIQSPGHMRAVKEAYEKAGYQSQVGEGLGQAVHHLDGYNWDIKGRNASSNLILLSKDVHDEFHSIYGKGNNTIEQFFEFLSNYHPEDLGKFIEDYVVPNAGMFGVDEKLLEASKDWDVDTWRKQFNRFNEIPYKRYFNEGKDNPLLDYIPYSSFFLNRMEVPVDKYDLHGNHEITQISTRDERVLDIYDLVSKHERAGYIGKSKKELLNILHARQQIEVLNGLIEESEMSNLDDFKFYGNGGKEEILKELDKSHERGRKALEDAISGDRPLSFLGKGFDKLEEEGLLDNTGIGKGLIPVIDRLKEFFTEYKGILEIENNPLKGWDSSKGITKENLEILDRLFSDKNGANLLLNHVLASLPVEGMGKIEDIGDPRLQREKIRKFNQEFYDNPDDERLGAFRDAKNDLAYISGILEAGLSIDTIGQFFSPQGKRKPLSDEFVRYAFGFNPNPTTDTSEIDSDLADMYEAMGYTVAKVSGGGKLVLTKEIQKESEATDYIQGRNPYSTTNVDNGSSGLTPLEQKELDKLEEKNLESLRSFVPKSCCDQLLEKLGEINGTVNKVGESIANALKNFKGGFRGSIYDENDMFGGDSSSFVDRQPKDKFYSGYKTRVNELEELIKSTEDEGIKKFAKDALSVAERMDKHGLRKSEWNQDLVYAIFGEYPKRENFSIEEEEKVRGKLAEIREARRNSTTQKIFDENIKKIDKEIEKVNESSDSYFKDETDGKTLSKQAYLSRLEARKRKWENKEIIGEDRYKFFELEEEAYNKVLNQPSPTEHYNDHINNYIKGIEGVKGYHELGTRSRFLETRGRLNEMGIDVSEEEEKAVAKINRLVSSYKKELKKDISESEKDDIQRTIDKLLELKSLFEKGDMLPTKGYYDALSEQVMPVKGSTSFSRWAYNAEAFLNTGFEESILKDNIRGLEDVLEKGHFGEDGTITYYIGGKAVKLDTKEVPFANQRRSGIVSRRKELEGSLEYYKQEHQRLFGDDSEGETKQFTRTELAYKRFDYLRERYESTKDTIERFRSNLDLLKDKGGAEQFDALIERLEYFKSELDSLADKDLRRTKLREQVKELTDDFYELSKTSERILGDDLLRRAEEASLQPINERNRLGISALFGDESAQEELFGKPPVPKPEKEPLRGRLTTMAYNFRQATQSATQLTGVVNKLFAIVGTGNAVNDMISASSIRQTNEIMLASRRGMEEAEKLYNRIQMLVVELPGNDTFLTNILTMLGTMDESLNAEDLEYMGGVIADYYMGAQAKGQFNNETERELRNYLMTGQTRNLTNSIIASEVESLKGLNTVKERTIALEKALQTTGMDSIAHYDSYTNTLEEFKGRFQKSFADLGDTYLGLLKMGMDLYNMLDRLTNSGLSQATIFGAVTVFGVLSTTVVFAELLSISASLIEAFDLMTDFVKDTTKSYSGLAEAYRQIIGWIAVKIGLVDADTIATSVNTVATDADTVSQQANAVAKMFGASATTADTVAKTGDTVATNANTVSIWGNILARLSSLKTIFIEIGARAYAVVLLVQEAIARYNNAFATAVENGTLISNTVTFIGNIGARLWSIATQITSIALTWAEIGALGVLTVVLWGVIGALYVLTFLTSPLGITLLAIVGVVWLMVKAFEGLGQAFGWWNDLGEMIEAFDAGIHRIWSAFANSKPVQDAIKTFQNLAYTLETLFNWIWNIGGNIWQTVFGVDNSTKEVFDIVGVFLEIVGAVGNFIYWISPLEEILGIFDAIGSTIAWFLETWNKFVETDEFQGIIKGFQDIRRVIGETWGILSEAFTEVKDAFMSIFESNDELEETKEGINILLEVLKAIAKLISSTIIPLIRFVAEIFKGIASVIKTVADIFSWFIGLFTNTGDYIGNFMGMVQNLATFVVEQFLGIPSRILEGIGGGILNSVGLGWLVGDNNNLSNQKQLAQNWAYNTNDNSVIINNNFGEGSVQADARNMTAKDVQRLFVGAFGYNKARGTQGVLN